MRTLEKEFEDKKCLKRHFLPQKRSSPAKKEAAAHILSRWEQVPEA